MCAQLLVIPRPRLMCNFLHSLGVTGAGRAAEGASLELKHSTTILVNSMTCSQGFQVMPWNIPEFD